MEFIADSVTAKGRFHEKNEDSFICDDSFAVIADGMGGEACGEVASQIAVSAISSYIKGRLASHCTEGEIRQLAFAAIHAADKEISDYIDKHPEAFGMGAAVLLLIRIERKIYVSWCGDSRCYYYSPAKGICRLTTDHSYVQQLINEGKITVEESFTHPDNNLITNFAGGGDDVCVPEFIASEFDNDGVIILCSDGLSGYCRDEEIEREIKRRNVGSLPERLKDLALRKGSDDDITIVAVSPKEGQKRGRMAIGGWFRRWKKRQLQK